MSNIQLVAYGEQDYYLTGNPQISYFKKAFRRHTNFVIEPFKIPLNQILDDIDTGFGKSYNTVLPQKGDLLHKLYLEIDIEGSHKGIQTYTINNFLNSLIKTCSIEIGGQIIDTHTSQSRQMMQELQNKRPKKKIIQSSLIYGGSPANLNFKSDINSVEYDGYDRLEGHCPLFYGGYSNEPILPTANTKVVKRLIYNFDFWFNKNIGCALPMIALQSHGVNLLFETETLINLIGDNTNISTDFKIKSNGLNVIGEYIILDNEEKKRFAQSSHEYLIEQVQYNGVTKIDNLISQTYELDNFKHPIKYIYWGITNPGTPGSNRGQGPCYFLSQTNNSLYSNDAATFSSFSATNNGTLKIQLNGQDRIPEMPMSYFTRQLPERYCQYPPELDRVGIYSFALNPFDLQPSGTCNFSRILTKSLLFTFPDNKFGPIQNRTDNIKDKNLYIYAINYNIFRIISGQGGVLFTN